MREVTLFSELTAGKINAERIAARIPEDINLLESVFLGIFSKLPRVKFGCSKSLLLLSEKQPELLYGKMDRIIELDIILSALSANKSSLRLCPRYMNVNAGRHCPLPTAY